MKIYNTLTRKKEDFVPIKKGRVGMYVCGPTVYDEPHIGHARSAYVFDVIRRYLKYRKFKVTFVRNVTDVDDKIIAKAKSTGRPIEEISRQYLDSYHNAMEGLLGLEKPDKEPKATGYIKKMIKFIKLLIKKDCAYAVDGNVYFNIKKAKNYGKLSNQNLEKLESGAKVPSGETKRDPLDFALWKKAKEGEPSWPSPWGAGRPGWHIECSVMSSDILGDEFDIHAGGLDLIFPHHENEIAQSEGAGGKFARTWIHNGLLTIGGEKMAKSLGNFVTIKDFIAKHKDADLLKLLFLSSHYRHPVDYTEEKIEEAVRMKERITIFLKKVEQVMSLRGAKGDEAISEIASGASRPRNDGVKEKFTAAMDDDFNTPEALGAIFGLVTEGNTRLSQNDTKAACDIAVLIKEFCEIVGLDLKKTVKIESAFKEKIDTLIKEREKARRDKDFKKADNIRDELINEGIIVEDTKEGPTWRRKL